MNLVFIYSIIAIIFLIAIIGKFKQEGITFREKTIVEIDPSKPIVALTFDDGPSIGYTRRILDVLYKNKSVATFFINGKNIEGNEKLLQKMVTEGNELANHTYNHYDLTTLSSQQVLEEINNTQISLEKVLPGYKLLYVRPPYGQYDEGTLAAVQYPIVLWDLDTGDWGERNGKKLYKRIMQSIKSGDIVIFHDTGESTVYSLTRLLPELRKKGFQFVTLSQLFEYQQKNPQPHQTYP